MDYRPPWQKIARTPMPELTQAAISQKPDKESLTLPPPLNPSFPTPPPTVETLSQQGPKRKRCRIQFVNYLDDH